MSSIPPSPPDPIDPSSRPTGTDAGQHGIPPGPPAGYVPDAETKNWAMAAHLSALLAAFVALAFLGPLVVWLIKKDDDPYVGSHAAEALNFQLSWLIFATVGGILGAIVAVLTFGLAAIVVVPVVGAAAIAWLVLTVIGGVKAASGELYRYPLTIRMVQ